MTGSAASVPAENPRCTGIDVLRIICMFLVLTLHILGNGGILDSYAQFSAGYELSWFIEIAAFVAVDCYALISGYVGLRAHHRYTNLAVLWLRVWFWSVLLTAADCIIERAADWDERLLRALFPVMSQRWWYFTAYFALFFLMPALNFVIEHLPQRDARRLVTGCIVLFSVMPVLSVLPGIRGGDDLFGTDNGYSVLWLAVLYLIGAYIRKYEPFSGMKTKTLLLWYGIMTLITWCSMNLIQIASEALLGEYHPGGWLVGYPSPTVLAAAAGLFIAVKRADIEGPRLRRFVHAVSGLSFSVYLIHEHPVIRETLMMGRFMWMAKLHPVLLLPVLAVSAALIFTVCCLLDLLRAGLFRLLRIKERFAGWEDRALADKK